MDGLSPVGAQGPGAALTNVHVSPVLRAGNQEFLLGVKGFSLCLISGSKVGILTRDLYYQGPGFSSKCQMNEAIETLHRIDFFCRKYRDPMEKYLLLL